MRAKWEVAGLFLKLGLTAFGGPAAHIALMRRETVERRRWLSEAHFLDLVGATNVIPGPNSTEMAIHIGYLRAGWPGLLLAGAGFIAPSALMVSALAWIYVRSGSLPQLGWLLYGVKPVVVALILHALWQLAGKAVKGRWRWMGFLSALGLYLLGANEIALLFGGGLAALMAGMRGDGKRAERDGPENAGRDPDKRAGPLLLPWGFGAAGLGASTAGALPFTLILLFVKFLKIGSVLYGSGYVLLPFLRAEFSERAGWLSEAQILDAFSVGQITPGPLFTTATFLGYVLGGLPGGLLATLGIFLPAFFFVALSNPYIPRIRASLRAGRFLDGINLASLALMAGAAWQTGRASVVDGITAALAVAALALLFHGKVSSTWLILGGGLIGLGARSWA